MALLFRTIQSSRHFEKYFVYFASTDDYIFKNRNNILISDLYLKQHRPRNDLLAPKSKCRLTVHNFDGVDVLEPAFNELTNSTSRQ